MIDNIYGILDYCYGGVPVLRGYVSYKTLLKYSTPHPSYQRTPNDEHIKEIEDFISKGSFKFMPEVILSYNCSGIDWPTHEDGYSIEDPILKLYNTTQTIVLEDCGKGIKLKGFKAHNGIHPLKIQINTNSPFYSKNQIFNRIDGNHRLEALSKLSDDYIVPFCIIFLSDFGYADSNEREKMEMKIFHNINSKVKPLTPLEQYKGLFNLFTVAELKEYGEEFSITKAYLQKHSTLRFNNISNYLTDKEDIVLFCIKFFLDREISINEDDIADIFSKLEHTCFYEFEIIRNCRSKLAIVPYVYYCLEGGKQKNAKLTAYNTWFIKNKLYNVKDIDPASLIEVFNSIFDIRKKQVFVAMPFRTELDFVFDAICETVEKINRENGTDLLPPVRIDKQIVGFSYDIVNEILENIQNAGLLIADLTDQNANVYYEVGYAQGLIKAKLGNTAAVLYLISNPDKPDEPFATAKFDVQHYKMIPYKNVGNGVNELKANLEKELKVFYCI